MMCLIYVFSETLLIFFGVWRCWWVVKKSHASISRQHWMAQFLQIKPFISPRFKSQRLLPWRQVG
jgi:hypothetical protein